MPELRIILLVAGAVLIAGLLLWERRRRRPAAPAAQVMAPAAAAVEAVAATATPPTASALPPAPMRSFRDAPDVDLPIIEMRETKIDLDLSFAHEPLPDLGEDDGQEPGPPFEVSAAPALAPAPPPAPVPLPKPAVVRWPAEGERRIVALRVMPRGAERFSGRSLRQALTGEGFEHGAMDIFHLADEEGESRISAANLVKPGTFDLPTMDLERFAGVNLFAVIPGGEPAMERFDRLIDIARALAARLNGELRDQHGESLTTARVLGLRQELEGPPA